MNILYVKTNAAYFLLRIFLNELVCDTGIVWSTVAGYTHFTEFTKALAIYILK